MNKAGIESYVPAVALALCTIAYSSATLDETLNIRRILLCACTMVLVALLVRRAISGGLDVGRAWNVIFALMILLVAWMALSAFTAINRAETMPAISVMAVYVIFTIGCSIAIKDDGRLVCRTAIVLSVVISCYALWQFFREGRMAATGLQSNRNLCCSAVYLLGMLGLYGAVKEKKLLKIISISALAAVAVALAIMLNRTVILAMAVSGLVLMSKSYKYVLVGLAVYALLFLGAWNFRRHSFNTESIRARSNLWNMSYEIGCDHPVLGVGAGNWRLIWPKYAKPGFSSSMITRGDKKYYQNIFYQRAHNDFLSMYAECGLAVFAYLSIFILALKYAWKNRILFAGITGYCVVAFFSFPSERACQSVVLALMIALAVRKKIRLIRPRNAYYSGLAMLTVLTVSLLTFAHCYKNEVILRKALPLRMSGDWTGFLQASGKCDAVDPLSAPVEFYRGQVNVKLKRYPEAIAEYEIALKKNPYHAFLLGDIGNAYAITGNLEKARESYKRALALNPDLNAVITNLEKVDKAISKR